VTTWGAEIRYRFEMILIISELCLKRYILRRGCGTRKKTILPKIIP
jgi:hypothetical protein